MPVINIRDLNSPYTIALMRLLTQGSLGSVMIRNNIRRFVNGEVQVYKVRFTPTDVNFYSQYNELARALGMPEVRIGVENTVYVLRVSPLTLTVPVFIEYVKRKLPIIYSNSLMNNAPVEEVVTHSVKFTHCVYEANRNFICQYEVY